MAKTSLETVTETGEAPTRNDSDAALGRSLVVAGNIKFDTLCAIPRMPRRHEKLRAGEIVTSLGGSGANTAAWLRHWGADVTLVGAVGRDPDGAECLTELRQAGVDCSLVSVVEGARTGRGVCLSSPREKRIITTSAPSSAAALDALRLTRIDWSTRILHVSAKESPELIALCREAAADGALLSVELGGRSLPDVCALASVGFLNHDELRRVFGLHSDELSPEDVERIMPRPDGRLVVTRGHLGAISVGRFGREQAPAHEVRLVERTGAGDAFNAGYLSAWVSGLTEHECLFHGNRSSAVVLGKVGAQPPRFEGADLGSVSGDTRSPTEPSGTSGTIPDALRHPVPTAAGGGPAS